MNAVRRGEHVLASSHAEAKRIARAASQKKRPIRDPAHKPDQMQHYHPAPRTGSHVFYSIASMLTLSNYVSCSDCVPAMLAAVVDFFNPLAIPKDMMDLFGDTE